METCGVVLHEDIFMLSEAFSTLHFRSARQNFTSLRGHPGLISAINFDGTNSSYMCTRALFTFSFFLACSGRFSVISINFELQRAPSTLWHSAEPWQISLFKPFHPLPSNQKLKFPTPPRRRIRCLSLENLGRGIFHHQTLRVYRGLGGGWVGAETKEEKTSRNNV